MNLIINFNELKKFCEINDFVLVDEDYLKAEGMYKNFVYATTNNFVGNAVYPENMPIIINKGVWNKLIKINNELKEKGKCITIYDAYRPIQIQRLFWNCFYDVHGYHDETLVADPDKCGTHNIKINAVDIIISNMDGSYVELPCEFDDFSEKANIYYEQCSSEAKENRDLLIDTAKKYGLIVNENEWWHFVDESILEKEIKLDLIPVGQEKVFILEN